VRGALAARIRLALLLLALGTTLGPQCGGGDGQTFVALIPEASSVGSYSLFNVEVRVSSPTPVQAYELGLKWDPAMLFLVEASPHPEFDDDGAFFTIPSLNMSAGTIEQVVDLQRGGEGAEGTFNVATAQFLSLNSPGPTEIGLISGGLADGSGNEIPVTVAPITIVIED
jgi:hypothetical protein